jgi:transposase InsO family protein
MQVSVSSYYRWLKQPQSPRALRNKDLCKLIIQLFNETKGRYGAPRLHAALRKRGELVGIKRVKRLTQENQLQARATRKYKATTDSQHNLLVASNLLKQQFSWDKPNQIWASDITFIPTQEGWLYLAVTLDLYARKVVGWAMDKRMTRQLVIDALHMAYWRRKPAKGLIHHSDKGSQYASYGFQAYLKHYGMIGSMSGTGNCYDNAVVEIFFHTLKVELVHDCVFVTRAQAKMA